jgi:hypothetical protein
MKNIHVKWHEQNSKNEGIYTEEDMLKCWNASNTLDSGINFKTFISQLKNKKSSNIHPIFEQILKPYIPK